MRGFRRLGPKFPALTLRARHCVSYDGAMRRHSPHSRHSGFTLLELMMVLTIATVVMTFGVPSYRSITTTTRISTEINGLLTDMQFARSEAQKTGLPVTVCVSEDGLTCAGRMPWHHGWIVFADPNGNATVDDTEVVLRIGKPLTGGDTFESAAGLEAITFNRAGFALNLPGAGIALTLHDATQKPAFTRCLAITMAGMITTQSRVSAPESCS